MANCSRENELQMLQSLIVRLSGEIDFKNHQLMEMNETKESAIQKLTKEKERLLAERSAAISVLVAENMEKDRLVGEKSSAIANLTEEKERLTGKTSEHVTMLIAQCAEKDQLLGEKSATVAMLTEEKAKLLNELSTARNMVEVKKERPADVSAATTMLMEQIAEKERLFNCLMEEKNQLLEARLIELEKTKDMKLENEKPNQDLESHKKELGRLTEKQDIMPREKVVIVDAEVEKGRCCVEPPKREPVLQWQDCEDSGLEIGRQKIISVLETQIVDDLRAQVDILRKELEDKEEALQNLELDNQTLMIQELNSNQELQDARKAAIKGLEAIKRPGNRMLIGIKVMGEVDQRPFRDACLNKLHNGGWDERYGKWEEKSTELCSSWQMNLSNPSWQPFRKEIINGKLTEVIDENDPLLEELKQEWGDEACKTVTEALLDVNEYNASGRYPTAEIWHYKENRKASMAEVVEYVIKQWQTHKNKRPKI